MSLPADHLDPVVIVRIMTCRNHDPAVKIICPCHIGNTRRRRYMQKICIRTRRRDTCRQRILEHITASSCILTDHNLRLVILSVVPAQEPPYLECMFHRQYLIRFTTETICSKIFTHNCQLLHFIRFICHIYLILCTIIANIFTII